MLLSGSNTVLDSSYHDPGSLRKAHHRECKKYGAVFCDSFSYHLKLLRHHAAAHMAAKCSHIQYFSITLRPPAASSYLRCMLCDVLCGRV